MKSLVQFLVVLVAAVGLHSVSSANLPLALGRTTTLAQAQKLVPVGTAAAAAEQIMTKAGYECHRTEFARAGKTYLACLRDDGRRIVKRRWLVQLELKEGRVAGHFVVSDLVGP